MRIRTFITVFAAAMLTCISCKPNIFIDEYASEGGELSFSEEGGSSEIKFRTTYEGKWSLVNYVSDWVYATPTAGLPGEVTVALTVSPNNGMEDRDGSIYILDGAKTLEYHISQPCKRLIRPESFEYLVSSDEGEIKVHVESKVSYAISCDSEWIGLPGVSFQETADLVFKIQANKGTESRKAEIVLEAKGVAPAVITVMQAGKVNVNWGAAFYKAVLGHRFTGDWCGWCPGLAHDIASYSSKNPARFNCICIYDQNSNARLKYDQAAKYQNRFGVASWPSLVLDQRGIAAGMTSPAFETIIKDFCNEELQSFKPVTAITASVSVNGDQISVHPTVFVKEAGTYHIHVGILENGVVVKQSDYTGLYSEAAAANWKHDNVVRSFITPVLTGEEFTAKDESSMIFNYSCRLPYNVDNRKNVSAVIYVTKPVIKGPSSVYGLSYYSNQSEFVDNSVIVKCGEVSELRYE